MPRQDGTGPDGSGRPGRGLGPCRKNNASTSVQQKGRSAGQGAGRGGRRGSRQNAQQ